MLLGSATCRQPANDRCSLLATSGSASRGQMQVPGCWCARDCSQGTPSGPSQPGAWGAHQRHLLYTTSGALHSTRRYPCAIAPWRAACASGICDPAGLQHEQLCSWGQHPGGAALWTSLRAQPTAKLSRLLCVWQIRSSGGLASVLTFAACARRKGAAAQCEAAQRAA